MDNKFKPGGYFTVQRKMLQMGGVSLQGSGSAFYKMYAITFRVLFVIYLCILVHDVIVNLDDLDVVIDSVYHLIGIVIVLAKIWMVSSNSDKLTKILKILEHGVFSPNIKRGGSVEEKWIGECVTNLNRLIIFSWVLSLITMSISIVATMYKRISNNDSESWELPFGTFTIFKPHQSPNFELAWLYQSVVFPVVAVDYLAADFLIVSVFSHICVQFRMLCNSINRIVPIDKFEGMGKDKRHMQIFESVETIWKFLAFKLKENVRYHIAILDLIQDFEDAINMLILLIYTTNMVSLGCIMYHASLYPISDPRFQKDTTMGMAVFFQLFLISYFANEVTLESEKLLYACFEPKFFEVDTRLQKGLGLVMARSQRSVQFTVGKFADFSLISFAAVVRASFSYYMLLHSIKEDN